MWLGSVAGVVRHLLGYLLMVHRERQYKRKIKLWNLRKNANVGDYSHIDQLMWSPSKVPQGIPITDDKIRRYVRRKARRCQQLLKAKCHLHLLVQETLQRQAES